MREAGVVCPPFGSLFYGQRFEACLHDDPNGYLILGGKILGETQGIVIAVIGNTPVPIDGGQRTFASPNAGEISLWINDDASSDNEGSFDIEILVYGPPTGDADEDGIDDALEDELLQYFAPTIFVDDEDAYRPTDAYWYLRSSQALGRYGDDVICQQPPSCVDPLPCTAPFSLPFYPESFLDPFRVGALWPFFRTVGYNIHQFRALFGSDFSDVLYYNGEPSSPGDPPGTNFSRAISPRTIDTDTRRGLHWDDWGLRSNVGIYGHVTPVDANSWVIQYWQFFGYNNMPLPDCDILGVPIATDVGDHEADWVLFEVYVDPVTSAAELDESRIRKAVWHAHGQVAVTWYRADLRPDPDKAWEGNEGRIEEDDWWANYRLNGSPSDWGGGMPNRHPEIYVESGMHEFWPYTVTADVHADYTWWPECDDYDCRGCVYTNPSTQYSVQQVPNLGELYRPRLGSEVILRFNGRWGQGTEYGESAPGPAQHKRREIGPNPPWRDAFPIAPPPDITIECGDSLDPNDTGVARLTATTPAIYVGKYNNAGGHGFPGSISNPFSSVAEAVDAAEDRAVVLIYPGTVR